jgi:hypothetical protein
VPITFSNPQSTVTVTAGDADDPVAGISVTDNTLGSNAPVVKIVLSQPQGANYPDLGSLTDPKDGGKWDVSSHTLTVQGSPTLNANQILNNVVYTAPTIPAGSAATVDATVIDNTVSDPTSVVIQDVTTPVINSTVANQPVAAGNTIKPFAPMNVFDANDDYQTTFAPTTIILKDATGKATDANGLLSGTFLSKTGTGTYTLATPAGQGPYALMGEIRSLVFTPSPVAAGQTVTTNFEVDVTDANASLSAQDTNTSVQVIGMNPVGQPLIAGTNANEKVVPNATSTPFAGVTITDANPNAVETVTITVNGSGTLNGQGVTHNADGTYTIPSNTAAVATKVLDGITYTPAGNSGTTSFTLSVNDGSATATDNKTSVTVVPKETDGNWDDQNNQTTNNGDTNDNNQIIINNTQVINNTNQTQTVNSTNQTINNSNQVINNNNQTNIGGGNTANNFVVSDNGSPSQQVGTPYSGPVAGITVEYVNVSADNLNVTANVPNAFIHSGSGNDALAANGGINVLDGGTGSNFLTGGSGSDTFFVDDRSATADIWSTMSNFHSGDAATIFGVTPGSFALNWADGQGATGYTGLTLHATAAGQPTASLTLVGFTTADLSNGRLSVSYGTTGGSPYAYVHAN